MATRRETFRWADEDSDSDQEIEYDDAYEPVRTFEYRFKEVFLVGSISSASVSEFELKYDDYRAYYLGFDDSFERYEDWTYYSDLILKGTEPSEIEHGILMLTHGINIYTMSVAADLSKLTSTNVDEQVLTMDLVGHADLMDDIASGMMDESESVPTKQTEVEIPELMTDRYCSIDMGWTNKLPPLAPSIPDGLPTQLILTKATTHLIDFFEDRIGWEEYSKQVLGYEIDCVSYDTFDEQTWRSSLSNTRKKDEPPVLLRWPDGRTVNIGIHGYTNLSDISISLDFTAASLALEELFSAPGGEGLTTPTPSHILHQMVSAVLSNAIPKTFNVLVEHGRSDISIIDHPHQHVKSPIIIDITSSASLFSKKLRPTKARSDYYHQAAITKYDFAACMSKHPDERVSKAFVRSSLNCLACEFPDYWRKRETGSNDLNLQGQIYDILASMPQAKIRSLGEMCFDAAMDECLDLSRATDFKAPGKGFREKKNVLTAKISSLKPRSNIAFPPIPISEIVLYNTGHDSIQIGDCIFEIPTNIIKTGSTDYEMSSDLEHKNFLENFPACGIISYDDAVGLAKKMDAKPLQAFGHVHKGPCADFKSSNAIVLEATNDIYSRSANAQYAEIRSDIARIIQRATWPKKNHWSQAWIYKNKVCLWYSARDSPKSPNGFRIDFFCVSKFQVAGCKEMKTRNGDIVYLWPRQKMRSQELKHCHMAPRKLKFVLYAMIDKLRAARCDLKTVYLAWERLCTTVQSSTWASGLIFLTSRYLSSSLASPSSPFDTMADKIVNPVNYSDVAYLVRLNKILEDWSVRDQYHDQCPILGLPRVFSQIESYWKDFVPADFADTIKNMAECVKDLHSEHQLLEETMQVRVQDLQSQLNLLSSGCITTNDLRKSLRGSMSIDTGGKFGWSFVGSLASGHALHLKADASQWDRRYARGYVAKRLVDSLTVRHSAYVDEHGVLHKATVAEAMVVKGFDDYCSKLDQTFRFLFISRPIFFNHPKLGENKNREISITDTDSRISLTDAELICGMYGKETGVDFLKRARKDRVFYTNSSKVLINGGVIQSSDAKRYGPMMSNFAIAIMLLYLGSFSMHLKWASVVYARLAYRKMALPLNISPVLEKQMQYPDTRVISSNTLRWIKQLPECFKDSETKYVWYCDSHHMGQGMSHHSSSLLHAGALIVIKRSVDLVIIRVHGKLCKYNTNIMVTSDDSTVMTQAFCIDQEQFLLRSQKQRASHLYMAVFRSMRPVGLRMVSVTPNLPKEVVASDKGEFNSNDSGIGSSCPILGFREGTSLLVPPSSPSLIGDYLNAHANSRSVAFAGQGLDTANFFHALSIDSIEERWRLTADERNELLSMEIIPKQLLQTASGTDLCSSPASWLHPVTRACLIDLAVHNNSKKEDLDPHVRDTVYGPLMHIRVGMPRQHRKAITILTEAAESRKKQGMIHASEMIMSSLSATMSSARTRNLGRIAFRVRNRIMTPRVFNMPDKEHTFIKGNMFALTMQWLKYINDYVLAMTPSPESLDLGIRLSGYIKISPPRPFEFPEPPRRKSDNSSGFKKPKYVYSDYGNTPFGVHALERSGCTQISRDDPTARDELQRYLIFNKFRQLGEHVEYGKSFVTDWFQGISGQISVVAQVLESSFYERSTPAMFGDFSMTSVEWLREIAQSDESRPVLALHRINVGVGIFHCIHDGIEYTTKYPISNLEQQCYNHTVNGTPVLLAVQGVSDRPIWTGSAPTKDEIDKYITTDINYGNDNRPSLIKSLEYDLACVSSTKIPLYSTDISIADKRGVQKKYFVYYEPDTHGGLSEENLSCGRGPYVRTKVVADLSLAGYWHSRMRGVCFRSYLRGHHSIRNIWTGSTIGWHSSPTSIPAYSNDPPNLSSVNEVFLVNGLKTADELASYDAQVSSRGVVVISNGATRFYNNSIRLSYDLIPSIYSYNKQKRHEGTSDGDSFLTVPYPGKTPEYLIDREEAYRNIESYINGLNIRYGW